MDKELMINLYIDQLLDAEEKAQVEALLEKDAELKKYYQAILLNRQAAFLESQAFVEDAIRSIDQKALKNKILSQIPVMHQAEERKSTWNIFSLFNQYQQGLTFAFVSVVLTLIAVKLIAFNQQPVEFIKDHNTILKIEHANDHTEPTTIWILDEDEKSKKKDVKKDELNKDKQPNDATKDPKPQ
jgi:hypothetical protein